MKREQYQFSIAQCDVPAERRPALETYRTKRLQWLAWLETDEHHAIWQTLSAMVWTDLSFRTLTQFAIDNDDTCLSNSLLAEQLINGHVATQVLAIRRLVDNTKSVISLRKLAQDIRANYRLFTRENYVCHDGLTYDYAAARERTAPNLVGNGPTWLPTTGPDAWSVSQMVHKKFDTLTGISSANRSRQDRLPVSLLNTIEGWIDASDADELAKWSHNFLAHAGIPESRARIAAVRVTNDKITGVIKSLARVAEGIGVNVLYASGRMNALVPTAQYDKFDKLELPVMTAAQKNAADDLWGRLADDRDACLSDVDAGLAKPPKP